jgi:hypothetical protein
MLKKRPDWFARAAGWANGDSLRLASEPKLDERVGLYSMLEQVLSSFEGASERPGSGYQKSAGASEQRPAPHSNRHEPAIDEQLHASNEATVVGC